MLFPFSRNLGFPTRIFFRLMPFGQRCILTPIDGTFFFFFSDKLGGCGLFGVGVWLSFTQAEFSSLPLSFPSLSAANLLLVAGGITMVTGFLGCLGALKEQRCLLFMVRGSNDRECFRYSLYFSVSVCLYLIASSIDVTDRGREEQAAFQLLFSGLQFFVILLLLVLTEVILVVVIHIFHEKVRICTLQLVL